MLRLDTHARIEGFITGAILKVVTLDEYVARGWPLERCALWVESELPPVPVLNLPWGALIAPSHAARLSGWSGPWIGAVRDPAVVRPGDVVAVRARTHSLRVLYRRGAAGNVLFTTDRCNSACLMCSQPPRPEHDGWRVQEILDTIHLIDTEERALGITGGEPTLLGAALADIVTACKEALPFTALHILSNGRLLGQVDLAQRIAAVAHPDLVWGIPLYADTARRHDHVVQAPGAFAETLAGLYRLAEHNARIEIRVVLQRQTLPRLAELARFIFRNLPFACQVALMGLEPMGYARNNREALWIDPLDYSELLSAAAWFLANRGIPVSIYNVPLCLLPADLHCFARRSISDWKQRYGSVCEGCAVQTRCCGFFASAGDAWISRGVRPLHL